jgi:hypothetical protein
MLPLLSAEGPLRFVMLSVVFIQPRLRGMPRHERMVFALLVAVGARAPL